MCGRFTLTADPNSLQQLVPQLQLNQWQGPRYNIAPSQPIPSLLNDGSWTLTYIQWGLIPHWTKDLTKISTLAASMINARSETLMEKPAFRRPFQQQRCLIFADGFYEWQARPPQRQKQPYYIHLKSGEPFAFAGLWDRWQDPNGSLLTTGTILTTSANPLLASLHPRMPVILDPHTFATWLDPSLKDPHLLRPYLQPYPASEMESYPVSLQVNRPSNDQSSLITPLADIQPQQLDLWDL